MSRSVGQDGPHRVDLHVGRRVAEKRIGMGLTQTNLGRALGLTFQQIQKYEKGANRISASKLWDAAAFLGVEIDYFLEGLADQAERAAPEPRPEPRPNRQSVEIAHLSRRLTTRQQKLVLDLMTSMSALGGGDGAESAIS